MPVIAPKSGSDKEVPLISTSVDILQYAAIYGDKEVPLISTSVD